MIKSFKHRGLEKYFYNGDKSRINPEHIARITRILDRLDASEKLQDMNLPAYKLRKLSGKAKDTWSVWVSGNWRVTFKFDKNYAVDVDYRDYH
jgi:proteic killer suppression protein